MLLEHILSLTVAAKLFRLRSYDTSRARQLEALFIATSSALQKHPAILPHDRSSVVSDGTGPSGPSSCSPAIPVWYSGHSPADCRIEKPAGIEPMTRRIFFSGVHQEL
jgi:hypothetical protein